MRGPDGAALCADPACLDHDRFSRAALFASLCRLGRCGARFPAICHSAQASFPVDSSPARALGSARWGFAVGANAATPVNMVATRMVRRGACLLVCGLAGLPGHRAR